MNQGQTFNPIVSESIAPVLGAGWTHPLTAHHALSVYLPECGVDADGPYVGRAPRLRRRIRRRYRRYEVDVAHHTAVLRLALPAQEEAFRFTAAVSLIWAVTDPVALARDGIRDVKPIICGFLDQLLRNVSRQFGIEENGLAEAEMNRRLEKEIGEIGFGLRLILLTLNLRPDAAAEEHLAGRVGARWATEVAKAEHALGVLKQQHAREQAELRGKLERAQNEFARELEVLDTRHQLDLKRQRVTFYQNALAGGSYDFLVLQLIEHPNDIKAVVEMLHAGREKYYDRARAVIKDLLDQRLVNAADMDPLRAHAIDQLRAALNIAAPSGGVVIEQQHTETLKVVNTEADAIRITTTPPG